MNNTSFHDTVEALQLTLHEQPVGVLIHHRSNRNQLVFDPRYRATNTRATLTLAQLITADYLDNPQTSSQQLSPVLSNLLPEGTMREWISKILKIDTNNEFAMLAYTGVDLPGALVAIPMEADAIPDWAINKNSVQTINVKTPTLLQKGEQAGFSLAGVQIKFSSARNGSRFNINQKKGDNSWIVKTPSTIHKHLPENEYSTMRLAESIGVTIPDIELVPLNAIDNLPDIELPNETYAYTIKRFDRSAVGRIHTEDFAQIMELYAHNKYEKANYEQIGALLYSFSANRTGDVQQMSRRLLANILLANGDAHLKNWTMIYPDTITPQLSQAYDIVSTQVYMTNEQHIALNMGKQKNWYEINMNTFEFWATRIGVPWPAIRVHLKDAMTIARDTWPNKLKDLPMYEPHKKILIGHWARLHEDFKILV